jgi:hypothetical protein
MAATRLARLIPRAGERCWFAAGTIVFHRRWPLCFDGQTMRKNSEISMRAYEIIAVGKAVMRL